MNTDKSDNFFCCKNISIDYAIMEKIDTLSAVPYSAGWNDLGGWDAVWLEQGPDSEGVVTSQKATAIECQNVLLRSENESQHLVGLGLEDIIAIAMPDAVLVAHKDRAQDIKLVVSTLKARGVNQAETFPKDHRPWGWFESLVIGGRFQVKRIHVLAGAALSLQSHHHRSEHLRTPGRSMVQNSPCQCDGLPRGEAYGQWGAGSTKRAAFCRVVCDCTLLAEAARRADLAICLARVRLISARVARRALVSAPRRRDRAGAARRLSDGADRRVVAGIRLRAVVLVVVPLRRAERPRLARSRRRRASRAPRAARARP